VEEEVLDQPKQALPQRKVPLDPNKVEDDLSMHDKVVDRIKDKEVDDQLKAESQERVTDENQSVETTNSNADQIRRQL